MKHELRLSGTGGQGLILAGIILAEAALLDGKLAIQSQSYGPEARGGSSKSEVNYFRGRHSLPEGYQTRFAACHEPGSCQ